MTKLEVLRMSNTTEDKVIVKMVDSINNIYATEHDDKVCFMYICTLMNALRNEYNITVVFNEEEDGYEIA